MADQARLALAKSHQSLLISGQYSDLKVVCGGDVYHVHKAIVCPQSSFFEKAVKFPAGEEAAARTIDLTEDNDPEIVRAFIEFLYKAEYDPTLSRDDGIKQERMDRVNGLRRQGYHLKFPHKCNPLQPCSQDMVCPHHVCGPYTCRFLCVNFVCASCTAPADDVGSADELLLHSKMYEIADKYDVESLKTLAAEKFHQACGKFWDDERFIDAIEHALTSTPDSDDGLRDVILETLASKRTLLDKSRIGSLVTADPDFALKLLRRQAEMVENRTRTIVRGELPWVYDSEL